MNPSLAVENLLRWSLQIVLLVTAGALVPLVLRMKMPQARLVFGQSVLVICLLLPALRPWRQEIVTLHGGAQRTLIVNLAAPSLPAPRMDRVFSTAEIMLAILAAGMLVRAGMLLFGLIRLRRYRLRSTPLIPVPTWSTEADVRVSADITGPVTFGFLKPVVLVPPRFRELSAEMRDAILCHEILHVRRHDWLFTAGEELIRALLWFHPAIWWLLREIQLVREEAVDREVVDLMKSRDGYIDALLLIAGAAQADLAPAPLFLRRQHLKHRVASILKEVRMTRFQYVSAFAASLTLVAASCWFITGALPLRGAPQIASDSVGVSVNALGAEVVRAGIVYPPEAIAKGVQGTVVARVKLDAWGNVTDATVLSGPDELRKAVLQSVLNWRFNAATAAAGSREVNVTFTTPPSAGQMANIVLRTAPAAGSPRVFSLPSTPEVAGPLAGRVVRSIKMVLSPATRAQIEARLPLHEGDTFTQQKNTELAKLAEEFDSHVDVMFLDRGDPGVALMIVANGPPAATLSSSSGNPLDAPLPPPPPPPPPPQAGRVVAGIGMRLDIRPVSQVSPQYPPLARAAHVQGTVSFQATIGTDGMVQNLQLVSGPPLLVQAAMDAVRQWVYPASATAVVTSIDITFTLPE